VNGFHSATRDLTLDEYRELAEFRHRIRRFQSATEQNARDLDINPDAHLLLIAVQGLPEGVRPTVARIAERMCLSREVVSAAIDAAVARNDLTRSSPDGGVGEDWVKLTRNGREQLHRMAAANRDELEHTGPDLARALQSVLKQRQRTRA
jgi:DNA-binding MarR family transcriptional regulator